MSQVTKRALEASLKNLLLQKPLNKITINDIAEDCGINRMTFYYHFKDIYDLVEWCCEEDAAKALAGKKTYETWQQGLLQIFEAVQDNKPFILNVYRSVSREQVENYLYRVTYDLLEGVVEEQAQAAGGQGLHRHALQIYVRRPHARLDQKRYEGRSAAHRGPARAGHPRQRARRA